MGTEIIENRETLSVREVKVRGTTSQEYICDVCRQKITKRCEKCGLMNIGTKYLLYPIFHAEKHFHHSCVKITSENINDNTLLEIENPFWVKKT